MHKLYTNIQNEIGEEQCHDGSQQSLYWTKLQFDLFFKSKIKMVKQFTNTKDIVQKLYTISALYEEGAMLQSFQKKTEMN